MPSGVARLAEASNINDKAKGRKLSQNIEKEYNDKARGDKGYPVKAKKLKKR